MRHPDDIREASPSRWSVSTAPPTARDQRAEKKEFYYVTTTDDPVMEKLAIEGKGNVFATDAILAHLMASPRTVYPWDIVVQKVRSTGTLPPPLLVGAVQAS